MHALRSPKNLTRLLLTKLTSKPEAELTQFEERFQTRLDRKDRKPQSTLGLAPRVPLQAMAQAVARLEAVAGEVNSQMRYALERLLKSEGEHLTPDDIEDAVKRVSRVAVTSTIEAKRLALATANTVDKFNRRDVRRTIGIDVPEYSAPLGERWRNQHIALIKSIPEEAKARFTGLLRDASKKQTRVETITKALREQEGITHRRARLIARDQVLTLSAKLNADRHKKAGIEEYEWLSLRDGSVRGNHAHLHGKRFRYDDPPMGGGTTEDERGNPGDGIGCRCQAVPVIPEFEKPVKKPEEKKPKSEKPKPATAPPKPPKRPEPPKVAAPAPRKWSPPPLKPEELKVFGTTLADEFRSLGATAPSGAPKLNHTIRTPFRERLSKHGATFDRPNKGAFADPKLTALAAAHILPPEYDLLAGHIKVNGAIAAKAERVIRTAKVTGNWEPAHEHVSTMVHEETHMAASADGLSYFSAPEHAWIEEATTELTANRITSEWIGTKPLKVLPDGSLSRGVAYYGTIESTLAITGHVLEVTKAEALELVTQAGLAMRRPGDQTRTYLQAFLDGLPADVTQAKKDELSALIKRAAASRVPAGKNQPVLDAKAAPAKSWDTVLTEMILSKKRPTAEQVDEVMRTSGVKSVTTGELSYFAMAGLHDAIVTALKKHGIKIVDDGNRYR